MNDIHTDRSMEIIEDALQTLPPAPVPARLRSRIMQRVRATATPRFMFPWLEAAISLMLATLLTGATYLLMDLPPTAILRLQQSIRLFFALPAYRPVIAVFLTAPAMVAVCMYLAVRLFRPRHRAPILSLRVR